MSATPAKRAAPRGYNYLTWVISFVLAVFIWAYVNRIRTEERGMDVRVEVAFTKGWDLAEAYAQKARVTLRGPRDVMSGIRTDQLRFRPNIEIHDEKAAVFTRRVDLKGDDLQGLPQGVSVLEIAPPSVELKLSRLVKRYVRVAVETRGQPVAGYELGSVMYEPHYVPVWAPEDQFTGEEVVKTSPIDITGGSEFLSRTVGLQALKLKDRELDVQDSVFAQIDIVEKQETRTLENVPVRLLLSSTLDKIGDFTMSPTQVNVTVQGRPDLVKALALSAVTIYVDTRDLGSSAQGKSVLKCNALAPQGITVQAIIPPEVTWTPRPKEPEKKDATP